MISSATAAPAQMGYVNGIYYGHSVHIPVEIVRNLDHIEQILECPHHSGLAVAAQAAQYHAAPPAGSQTRGKASDLRFHCARTEECASETAYFAFDGTFEQFCRSVLIERQPKTLLHSPRPRQP